MSATGDLFARRDRIEGILHDVVDDHTRDAESPAYADAIRRAAEHLLASFEISDGRSEVVSGVHLQVQDAPGTDHAAEAMAAFHRGEPARPFRETEADRRAVERIVQDTPAKTTIVPIIVGWWKTPSYIEEVLLSAKNGTIDLRRVMRMTTAPGEVARVSIEFRIPRLADGQVLVVTVDGADAKSAIEAWDAGQ